MSVLKKMPLGRTVVLTAVMIAMLCPVLQAEERDGIETK